MVYIFYITVHTAALFSITLHTHLLHTYFLPPPIQSTHPVPPPSLIPNTHTPLTIPLSINHHPSHTHTTHLTDVARDYRQKVHFTR